MHRTLGSALLVALLSLLVASSQLQQGVSSLRNDLYQINFQAGPNVDWVDVHITSPSSSAEINARMTEGANKLFTFVVEIKPDTTIQYTFTYSINDQAAQSTMYSFGASSIFKSSIIGLGQNLYKAVFETASGVVASWVDIKYQIDNGPWLSYRMTPVESQGTESQSPTGRRLLQVQTGADNGNNNAAALAQAQALSVLLNQQTLLAQQASGSSTQSVTVPAQFDPNTGYGLAAFPTQSTATTSASTNAANPLGLTQATIDSLSRFTGVNFTALNLVQQQYGGLPILPGFPNVGSAQQQIAGLASNPFANAYPGQSVIPQQFLAFIPPGIQQVIPTAQNVNDWSAAGAAVQQQSLNQYQAALQQQQAALQQQQQRSLQGQTQYPALSLQSGQQQQQPITYQGQATTQYSAATTTTPAQASIVAQSPSGGLQRSQRFEHQVIQIPAGSLLVYWFSYYTPSLGISRESPQFRFQAPATSDAGQIYPSSTQLVQQSNQQATTQGVAPKTQTIDAQATADGFLQDFALSGAGPNNYRVSFSHLPLGYAASFVDLHIRTQNGGAYSNYRMQQQTNGTFTFQPITLRPGEGVVYFFTFESGVNHQARDSRVIVFNAGGAQAQQTQTTAPSQTTQPNPTGASGLTPSQIRGTPVTQPSTQPVTQQQTPVEQPKQQPTQTQQQQQIQTTQAINGGWSDWSKCSAECGPGLQYRVCNNPAPANNGALCQGQQTRYCIIQSCPQPSPVYQTGQIQQAIVQQPVLQQNTQQQCGPKDYECQMTKVCSPCYSNQKLPMCLECYQLSLCSDFPCQVQGACAVCAKLQRSDYPQACVDALQAGACP